MNVSVRPLTARVSGALKDIWRHDPFLLRARQLVDLTLPDLQSLRAVIETEATVKRRRDLVLEGYEFSKLYFIKEGFAARYKLLRNGKRQIVNFVLPGDIVGMPGSFLDRAANSVIAVSDMTLQICSLEAFVGLCCRQPKFGLVLKLAGGAGGGPLCRARNRRRPPDAGRAVWLICCSKFIPGLPWSGWPTNSHSTCRLRRR